jgi:hypothetical protein
LEVTVVTPVFLSPGRRKGEKKGEKRGEKKGGKERKKERKRRRKRRRTGERKEGTWTKERTGGVDGVGCFRLQVGARGLRVERDFNDSCWAIAQGGGHGDGAVVGGFGAD